MKDHVVARAFNLTSVITTFDAETGHDCIDEHFECWKQLAFADHIVITKGDLAFEPTDRHRVRRLNPSALLHDCHSANFDPISLIGDQSYSAASKPEDAIGWLAMERYSDPDEHAHNHDPNRHGADITALPLTHSEPLDPEGVERFLKTITSHPDVRLLRLKGLFALSDDPTRPLIVHAVRHKLYPTVRLECWPDEDVSSRVILIGNKLPIAPVRELFDALKPKQQRKWFSRK